MGGNRNHSSEMSLACCAADRRFQCVNRTGRGYVSGFEAAGMSLEGFIFYRYGVDMQGYESSLFQIS